MTSGNERSRHKQTAEGRGRALAEARALARKAQEQTAELEALIESMEDAICVANTEGLLVRANRAGLELLGLKSTQEACRPLAEYTRRVTFRSLDGRTIPPEDCPLARALRGETFTGYVFRSEYPDGRVRWASASGAPVRDERGSTILAVNVTRDITAQVEAGAERLRLLGEIDGQRQLFEAIIEHAPVAIGLLRGPSFVYELVNPAYQAFAPGNVMLGRPFAEAWPEAAAQLRPIFEPVLQTGDSYQTTDMRFSIQRAPGTPVEEAYFTFAVVRMRVPDGRTDALMVLAVETTEQVLARKRIEDLAAMAQQRAAELQSVLDNMVDGVFVCDAEGRITLVNEGALQLVGLNSVDEAKRPLPELIDQLHTRHPDGKRVARDELPLVRALAGAVVVQENELIHNLRTQRDTYLWTSAAPIRDNEGKIVGAVEVARDVTELSELDRLKDQFIAVAAHELKTPVTVMKGYAQALLRMSEAVPPPRRMLEAIDRGADRIHRIVNDLLDVSRLQRGLLGLEMERVDLPELVAQVEDRMALTTVQHRLRLVRADPVVVQGDRDRLEQVLLNLLDNAIKYSPRGGNVDVEVAVRDQEAVVSVRDQGVGIPLDRQARVFQRFYRAHTSTPYDYGGMGVGLFISREIVARHGGRMWFESEAGRGSAFHFSLPLSPAG